MQVLALTKAGPGAPTVFLEAGRECVRIRRRIVSRKRKTIRRIRGDAGPAQESTPGSGSPPLWPPSLSVNWWRTTPSTRATSTTLTGTTCPPPIRTGEDHVFLACILMPASSRYEYTISDDRYWRKTRAPNAGSSCKGVDPNRNWAFHWAGERRRYHSELFNLLRDGCQLRPLLRGLLWY